MDRTVGDYSAIGSHGNYPDVDDAPPTTSNIEAPVLASDVVKKLGYRIPDDCYMDCDVAEPFHLSEEEHVHELKSFSQLIDSLTSEKESKISIFEARCATQANMIDQWSSGLQVGELEEDQSDRRIWQYVSRRTGTKESLELAKRHVEANPDCTHDRGPDGALPVHMCFLINGPFHRAFGMFMIDFDDRLRSTPAGAARRRHLPRLIDIPYFEESTASDVFRGQNLLHCALVHRDTKLVEWLLERSPRLILGFCSGTFYSPDSPCYFGSTPLHFAAVTGQKDMVQKILDIAGNHELLHSTSSQPGRRKRVANAGRTRFAEPEDPSNLCNLPEEYRGPLQQQRFLDQPDHWGNNVLHLLVACSGRALVSLEADMAELNAAEEKDPKEAEDDAWLVNMYDFILQCEEKVRRDCFTTTGQLHSHRLSHTLNRDCHVPFVMAAAVGNRVMFKHILDRSSVFNWDFGPIVCKSYSLEAFDAPPTLHPHAPSALQVLVADPGDRHLRFFEDPVILRVVNKNWLAYAKGPFYTRLGLSMLAGVFVVLACLTEAYLDLEPVEGEDAPNLFFILVLAVIARIGLAISAMSLLRKELRVITQEGISAYLSETGAAFLENSMSWLYILSVTAACILPLFREAGEAYCHASLALVSVCYCGYLFYFFLGFELTGGYLVMIFEMVGSDMVRFSAAFATLILGFTCAFFLLFMEASLEGFAIMLRDTFLMAVGPYDAAQFLDCRVPWLCTVLMCVYIVVVNVLLFNLLIATMGETYGRMFDVARQTWMIERCRIMLSIKTELGGGSQPPAVEWYVVQRMQVGLNKTGSVAAGPADLLSIMDDVRAELRSSEAVTAMGNADVFAVPSVGGMLSHDGAGTDVQCKIVKRFQEAAAEQTMFQRFMVAVEPVTTFDASAPPIDEPSDVGGNDGGGDAGGGDAAPRADDAAGDDGAAFGGPVVVDRVPSSNGGAAAGDGRTFGEAAGEPLAAAATYVLGGTSPSRGSPRGGWRTNAPAPEPSDATF